MTEASARAGPTRRPEKAAAAPAQSRWIGSIDGLRVIAAVGVVVFHMQAESHVSQLTSRITASLVVPVFALFFVVSGFVLYRPWAKVHLAATAGQRHIAAPDGGITTFWLRRAFRVFPLYWAVLVFAIATNGQTAGLHGLGDWVQLFTLFPFPKWNLLFTHGIGLIVWTMLVELAFYLALPLWGRAVSRVIAWGATPLVAELAPVGALTVLLTGVSSVLHLAIGAFALLFVGMLMAVAAGWQAVTGRPVPGLQWLADRSWVAGLVVLACWTAGSSVAQSDDPKTLFNNDIWLHLGAMIIVAVALFIPAVFGSTRSRFHRVMSCKAARLAGPLTYGIYLWHYPIERVVHDTVGTSFFPLILTVLPLSVAAAFVTNRVVEEPMDRLRHRMFGRTMAARAEPSGNGHRPPDASARRPRPPQRAVPAAGTAAEKVVPDSLGLAEAALSADSWAAPITGFRAIAAIVVVVGHTFLSARTYPFTGVVHVAGLVVPAFFVISAYALYRPYVVNHVRGVKPRSARSFWWRRFLRIYPLYAVALTAYLVLLPGVRPHTGGALSYVKLYAFLQVYDKHLVDFSGIPAAWFLCDEVAFYLAIPIIAFAAAAWANRNGARSATERMHPHLMIAILFCVVGPFIRAALVIKKVPGATSLPISNLDFYGLGMIIGILSLREHLDLSFPRPIDWVRRRPPVAYGITFIALFTLAVVAKKPDVFFEPHQVIVRYALWTVAVVPLMGTLLLGDQTRGANRFLSGHRFSWLGALSLHVYLWHQLLLGSFDRYWSQIALVQYGPRFTTIIVIEIVIVSATVALSAALRPLLDAPHNRWADRFDGPRGPAGAASRRPLPARPVARRPGRRMAGS